MGWEYTNLVNIDTLPLHVQLFRQQKVKRNFTSFFPAGLVPVDCKETLSKKESLKAVD